MHAADAFSPYSDPDYGSSTLSLAHFAQKVMLRPSLACSLRHIVLPKRQLLPQGVWLLQKRKEKLCGNKFFSDKNCYVQIFI
jgi:hypothetical protein